MRYAAALVSLILALFFAAAVALCAYAQAWSLVVVALLSGLYFFSDFIRELRKVRRHHEPVHFLRPGRPGQDDTH